MYVYSSKILYVFWKYGAEHVSDLENVFERLTMFNLKLAPKKAYLGMRTIKFLGHRVTTKGVEPDLQGGSHDQPTHANQR